MKKIKKLLSTIAILVIVAIGVFSFLKFSNFNFGDIFKEKPITIDKTTNVIEEINQLAEFTTATYYQEIIIKELKERSYFGSSYFGDVVGDDELVLIIKGTVRAGFDFSTLSEEDIIIEENTIKLKLPKVKIIETITNPSDFETYVETGKWSFEEVNVYKNKARERIEASAIAGGILELAEKSGVEKLTSLLEAFGFKQVVVELL